MPSLPGFTRAEAVSVHGDVSLYRAERAGTTFLIKLPSAPQPSLATLERLRHEAALAEVLAPGFAVRPLALEQAADTPMLVLEDFDGQPLDTLLGPPMPIGTFLPLAIKLAAALEAMHRHQLIHKDLKPQHILVAPGHTDVRLTGFGIASRLPREQQGVGRHDHLEGTLAYISPEQTGRMNRVVDHRTDLYALGVIAYELLTGTLPCQGRDPMEWVHCHIAIDPVPPSALNPSIPRPVSDVVMKLLQKDTEERYQTIHGLMADLERCLAQHREGRWAPFPLGQRDVSERFSPPQKLYGRERESAALRQAFARVAAAGQSELVLVSGYSGIGKSALALELQQPVAEAGGFFLTGKFDQFKRDIPYATIAQAFQQLIQQLLTETEDRIEAWRQRLGEALGINAQLIIDLIPPVERIIGAQPPVPELPLSEAQHRFWMVFRQFVGVFAGPAHPLVVFLDDLQWVDSASLQLLTHLLTHPDTRHLLVVGAYRSNEVGPAHPLRQALDAAREAAPIHDIVLEPLSVEDLTRLIADTLRSAPERAAGLAELVFDKTRGNPFFALQFLGLLVHEQLLAFDPQRAEWAWDLDHVRAMGFSDNIVELMVRKLQRLPAPTLRALELAACVGNQVALPVLAELHEQPQAATLDDLRPAFQEGLMLPQGDTFRFLHDRIQQAAYGLLPPAERSALHLRIGRMLLADADHQDEALFEIVTQLNLGASLLTDPAERERVAEVNLQAGRRAKASTAYRSAAGYLSAGLALLPGDAWASSYALTYALHLERAECELLSGRFAEAESEIARLLQEARTALDRAPVYQLAIALHETRGEAARAIEVGLEALRLFGIELSPHPTDAQVASAYAALWDRLGDRAIESLGDMPPMRHPEIEAAMAILSALPPTASFTDKNLFTLLLCEMIGLSLEHGNAPASVIGYVTFGLLIGPAFGRYQEGYRFGRLACQMADRHGSLAAKAVTYFIFGNMINHWTQPLKAGHEYIRIAFETAVEVGNLTYACYACVAYMTGVLASGAPLAGAYQESEWRLEFARSARFEPMAQIVLAEQRFIQAMRGLTAHLSTFDGPEFDEAAFEAGLEGQIPVAPCLYYMRKAQSRYLAGDHAEALQAAERAQSLLWAIFMYFDAVELQFYTALILASVAETASPDARTAHLERLGALQAQLGVWAGHCPENFQDRHALVSAELARLNGQDQEAMRLYEQAIRSARSSGFVHNEALANELAARFYLARGFETIALAYMRDARYGYARWGADGKVQQLERLYPQLREPTGPAHTLTVGTSSQQLDLLTVIKASQAISQAIVLPELAETLMRAVLEHAGAQQGHLLLRQDGGLRVVAETHAHRSDVRLFLDAPLDPAERLPVAVINYVRRTREPVVLDDALKAPLFASDAYMAARRPRSVLALPIVRQADLIGMLYLENNLTTGAFSADHLTMLELLAAQAAISFENATLYAERQRAEARYRQIVETAYEGIWLVDERMRTTFANARLAEMFHTTVEAMAGRAIEDFVFPEDRAKLAYFIDRRKRGVSELLEFRFRREDGSELWTLLSTAPILDAEGRLVSALAMVTDNTERKRAEEERLRLIAQEQAARAEVAAARELERLKNDLVNSVTHELRTPLTSIKGYLEFLEDGLGGPLTPEQLTFVQQIEKGAERLAWLVDDLLDFARIDAGTFQVRLTDGDLGEKVREIVDSLRPQAESAHLALAVALPDAPLTLPMDAHRIGQVLINLLSNAIKFTPAGGTIQVRVVPEGAQVRCEVTDTGIGIAEADIPKLFQRFSQLEGGLKSGVGTGLGLNISKTIIEAHGGRIGVTSRPGQGSTFWFTLPMGRQTS